MYCWYDPELTAMLRYIMVTVPSAGENKCTVLRNIENVGKFFQSWVEDTKKMDLAKVKDGYAGEAWIGMLYPLASLEVEADIMRRMCGKNTLRKLRKEGGWGSIPNEVFEPLEAALQVLEDDLFCSKKDRDRGHGATAVVQEKKDLHRDDVADWEPQDSQLAGLLQLVTAGASSHDMHRLWGGLGHGQPAVEVLMSALGSAVTGLAEASCQCSRDGLRLGSLVERPEDDDPFMNNVPLRTSRGKAGGLNFAENYLSIYADKPENMYGDERDHFPCLYSICDARHQFQTDFFHSTIPYFFDDEMDLNPYVGFTQCPQFFHEMQDKLDYLDNNNAQFFRLNCMIRNCCRLSR
eukprot:Skav210100  [mRNA]  locus=scaffold1510:475244:479899:- [translate_table: standard]